MPAAPPTRSSVPWVVGGGVAAALVAVVASLAIGGETEVATPAPETVQEPPADEAPAVPPPIVQQVRLSASTTPPGAELRLDGEIVANPYSEDVSAEGQTARFEARLDGYEAARQEVIVDGERSVELVLEAIQRGERPPRRGMTPRMTALMMAAEGTMTRETTTMETTAAPPDVPPVTPMVTPPNMVTMDPGNPLVPSNRGVRSGGI